MSPLDTVIVLKETENARASVRAFPTDPDILRPAGLFKRLDLFTSMYAPNLFTIFGESIDAYIKELDEFKIVGDWFRDQKRVRAAVDFPDDNASVSFEVYVTGTYIASHEYISIKLVPYGHPTWRLPVRDGR